MLQSTQPIAEKIRELRKRHGLSQGELAAIAGVSLPTVYRKTTFGIPSRKFPHGNAS